MPILSVLQRSRPLDHFAIRLHYLHLSCANCIFQMIQIILLIIFTIEYHDSCIYCDIVLNAYCMCKTFANIFLIFYVVTIIFGYNYN
jgi:hypothetical protein